MLELEVTVVERRTEAQDICSLTLAPSAGTELPSHEAGSHIDVQIGDVLVRQYSPQGALCGGHRRRQVPLDHARPSSPLANPASAGPVTRVLDGIPRHLDSYLTDTEHAANDCFTPCC